MSPPSSQSYSLQATQAAILSGTALIPRGFGSTIVAYDLPICFDNAFKSANFIGGSVSIVGTVIINGSRTFSLGTDGIGLQFTYGSNSSQAAISIPVETAEALVGLGVLVPNNLGGYAVATGVTGIVKAYYSKSIKC